MVYASLGWVEGGTPRGIPVICLPVYPGRCIPWLYASLYTRVGVHPGYMPPYVHQVGIPASQPPCVHPVLAPGTPFGCHSFTLLIRRLKSEGLSGTSECLSSLRINLSSQGKQASFGQETRHGVYLLPPILGRHIPQRVTRYKDGRNPLTPLGMTPDPLKAVARPFTPGRRREEPPCLGWGLSNY